MMITLKNSYIFLEHPKKPKNDCKDEKGNIVLVFGKTVHSFIKQTFPSIVKDSNHNNLFGEKLDCTIDENNVSFVISSVREIMYLDVIVSGKTRTKVISCLETIQERLNASEIRSHYVDIVSYDSISEYYCNKIFIRLNSLERNLRKLLFNIYVLNFGKEYYSATMKPELQAKIKKVIRVSTSKEDLRRVGKEYGVSNTQAEDIVRLQQFFYSFEFSDLQQFLFVPVWTDNDEKEYRIFLEKNENLSELSDLELRNAFEEFKPKSDWERFFKSKISIAEIEEKIEKVRKYRNMIAHLKFFERDDFFACKKLMTQLNKAILEAIKITEEKDFAEKNAEALQKALFGISEKIESMVKYMNNIATKISQSKYFQNFQKMYAHINEQETLKKVEKTIVPALQFIGKLASSDTDNPNDTVIDDS